MEKYDRDVEQKQHELDVLKVCSLNRFSSRRVRKHSRVEKVTASKLMYSVRWMSKVIQNYFSFSSLRTVIGQENLRHPCN